MIPLFCKTVTVRFHHDLEVATASCIRSYSSLSARSVANLIQNPVFHPISFYENGQPMTHNVAIVDSLYREMIEAKDPHDRKEHAKKEHHKDHHKKHDKQHTEAPPEKAPAGEKAPAAPAPEKGKKGKK